MSPNARPTSPQGVIDLTPIITIGVRDWDIDITIRMFEEHLQQIRDMGDEPAEFTRVTQARLHLIRAGHADPAVTMMPDVNSGHYLTAEDWFMRYGFAPDMVTDQFGAYVDPEAPILRPDDAWQRIIDHGFNPIDDPILDDLTVSTASITLGSQDTYIAPGEEVPEHIRRECEEDAMVVWGPDDESTGSNKRKHDQI